MSKVKELIKELCPNGVEYKKLSDVVPVNRGSRLTKSQLSDNGLYEVYHGSKDVILGKYDKYNTIGDTVIVVNTGGIGGVKYLKNNFWCSDGSFNIGHSEELNNKYLYHFLSQYENYFLSQKRVGGVPTIDKSVIEKVRIPIPPIEVQEEIVRILDKFGELEAELEARQSQYEFWRGKLCGDNKKEYKKVRFRDIATITRGGNFQKKDYVEEGYPCIHYGQIYTYFGPYTDKVISYLSKEVYDKQKKAHTNDVIMAVTSENYDDLQTSS